MTETQRHLDAAKYASNRKARYVEAMEKDEVDTKREDELNETWLAHYEGYQEGYRIRASQEKEEKNA